MRAIGTTWERSRRDPTRQALSSRVLHVTQDIALFVFFLSLSTSLSPLPTSIDVGFAGWAALLVIFLVWLDPGRRQWADLSSDQRWLIGGFALFLLWSAVLWLIAEDWGDRSALLIGWALSTGVLAGILGLRRLDFRRIAALFVVAAVPDLVVGTYQHFAGIGLGVKNLVGLLSTAGSVPILGLFGHPNDFASYLYWPFIVSAGLGFEEKGWRRGLLVALAAALAVLIFWTYSRATLLAVGFAIVAFLGSRYIRSKRSFVLLLAGFALAGALVLVWAFRRYSLSLILSGRQEVWAEAINLILHDPHLLVLGYLAVPPAGSAIFYNPHNIYLLAWTIFGVVGLIALVALGVYVLLLGWRAYSSLPSQPTFRALWAGMAGLFLMEGMVDLYFHEVFVQLIFTAVLALMLGLAGPGWNLPEPPAETRH